MATQAVLRNSEWDEENVQYHNQTVTVVFRRSRGQEPYEPWVIVAPSALMNRVGVSGLGLYAAKPMKKDQFVGKYPSHNALVKVLAS